MQAEILTLNFKLDTGKTFSISTFYRVNNLGVENLENFKNYMTELALANKMKKHIVMLATLIFLRSNGQIRLLPANFMKTL